MTELRWVLLALGVLVIVAVYLWSQGIPQRLLAPILALRKQKAADAIRVEPAIGDADSTDFADDTPTYQTAAAAEPEVAS